MICPGTNYALVKMDEFACGSVCNLSVSPSNIVNCLSRDSEKERKNMCVSENLDFRGLLA